MLNVVTGTGPEVGEPIGRHPGIDAVSFTGSTETGRRFLRFSADSNLKEVVLEMGGKNPCIVMDDAEDLEAVAGHVVNGAYWNMGENCSAISRLIVHRDVKDALVEKLVAALDEWQVGDPLDPDNRVGPLVSDEHFRKVRSFLGNGEKVLHGGEITEGRYVHPTIIELAGNDERPAREEIFGPILAVIPVDSLKEAVGDRQRHRLRPRGLGLHRQRQARDARRPRAAGRDGDGELLRRGRHHHAVRRLQAVGLRRAGQLRPRARPVHPAQDDLARSLQRGKPVRP